MKFFDTKIDVQVRVYFEQREGLPLEICYLDFMNGDNVLSNLGKIERHIIKKNEDTFIKKAKNMKGGMPMM